MTARAHVEYDVLRDAVKVAMLPSETTVMVFSAQQLRVIEPNTRTADTDFLYLPKDLARSLYEALADHFGHSGHDTRALRRDYDAERARVDRLTASVLARLERD